MSIIRLDRETKAELHSEAVKLIAGQPPKDDKGAHGGAGGPHQLRPLQHQANG